MSGVSRRFSGFPSVTVLMLIVLGLWFAVAGGIAAAYFITGHQL